MKQPDFIMMAKTLGYEMNYQGNYLIVPLGDQAHVAHNWRKNNPLSIVFLEDQTRYDIKSRSQMEEVFRHHAQEGSSYDSLRKWCDQHLSE